MRFYVFTPRERRIVEAYLAGEKVDPRNIARIRHELRRHRSQLEGDIQLLQKLAETL